MVLGIGPEKSTDIPRRFENGGYFRLLCSIYTQKDKILMDFMRKHDSFVVELGIKKRIIYKIPNFILGRNVLAVFRKNEKYPLG